MWSQIWPLLALALIIICSIAGTGWVAWLLYSNSLDPKQMKRANSGRRSSDKIG